MRVAFDSRPASDTGDLGRYTRCLLGALREIDGDGLRIVETQRPSATVRSRRADVFHSPSTEGALLRCPCPMVVTLHDVESLTRRSERLRCGGVHLRLRDLALARAAYVIVTTNATADAAVERLGLERERIVVIAEVPGQAAACRWDTAASQPATAWTWADAARATVEVYERALAEPARPFVSTRRAASARRGSSSAGSRDLAPGTSAPGR